VNGCTATRGKCAIPSYCHTRTLQIMKFKTPCNTEF